MHASWPSGEREKEREKEESSFKGVRKTRRSTYVCLRSDSLLLSPGLNAALLCVGMLLLGFFLLFPATDAGAHF